MTVALILATAATDDGTAAALLPLAAGTPLQRLLAQLRRAGVVTATVHTRPEWVEAIRAAVSDVDVRAQSLEELFAALDPAAHLLVAEGHGVGHDAVVEWTVRDEDTVAVVDDAGASLGLLGVAAAQRAALAGDGDGDGGADVASIWAHLTVATPVRRLDTGPLAWALPTDAASAAAAEQASATPSETVMLRAAVKGDDAFFPTYFVSPYSKYIARWAAHRGVSPNQITVLSLALGLGVAPCFALGTRAGLVAGAVLLQVSYLADTVDGQVARYARRSSPFGAWMDSTFDRLKEYVVYAGLAVGGIRAGGDDSLWVLAAAALALQTVRHMAVFAYDEAKAPGPRAAKVAGAGMRVLGRADRVPLLRWAKRILVLPIGERFALISVTAAVATPRTTFVWLLAWGSVAAAYMVAGRLLRATAALERLALYRDDGPVVKALARLRRPSGAQSARARLAWLAPALLRAAEYGVLVWVAWRAGGAALPVVYVLLIVVAFHHYDLFHRAWCQQPPPGWVNAAGLGWDGRIVVMLAAWALHIVAPAAGALAVLCGVVFVGESVLSWRGRRLAGGVSRRQVRLR